MRALKLILLVALIVASFHRAISATITYSSSIDPITLTAEYYPATNGAPVMALIHGYSGDATAWNLATIQAFTNAGFSVVIPDMRGRRTSGGTADDSAREIMDIRDAVIYVRATYPVSQTNALIYGFSGGGGNVLNAACKIPDTFAAYVDYSGISDYGADPVNGWYASATNATYLTLLRTRIGGHSVNGTPANFPNNYAARNSLTAIGKNLLVGKLWMFHNTGDGIVKPTNSFLVKAAMDAASNTRYTLSTSSTLYAHGYPTAAPDGFDNWKSAVFDGTVSEWTFPASGTVQVLGYLVTKRFSVWLGGGLDGVADLTYSTDTFTYTLTPLTAGSMLVQISQPGKYTVARTISSETTIVLSEPTNKATVSTAVVGTITGQ